jgi:hypothetical protein
MQEKVVGRIVTFFLFAEADSDAGGIGMKERDSRPKPTDNRHDNANTKSGL